MTRKREWYEGAVYHVTVRGNRRNDTFRDKEDFEYYLNTIEEALFYYIQFNYKVICYCLMDNHVHLMIKTDIEPLGKLMGRISASYTRYFNKKYNYIGHLFQDRYFSELIKSDEQMLVAPKVRQETFDGKDFYPGFLVSDPMREAHLLIEPRGIFQYPNELGDEAFQRLKKDITKNYTGLSNAGVPMILEGGGQFKEITMKLTDGQFIESKRFRIEDVCRMFRVPLHLVQDLTRATNNNIEHQSLGFIMYTMLPWFKRWEENLNLQLLSPESKRKNRYFQFNISGLLRGDIKSRYEAYEQGRQWGWLFVNDIRRFENMNPIENGDRYLEPLNMSEAGKQQEQLKALREEVFNLTQRLYGRTYSVQG